MQTISSKSLATDPTLESGYPFFAAAPFSKADTQPESVANLETLAMPVAWNPRLDTSYLSEKSQVPGLVIASHDTAAGLFAGYRATNGVRFLVRAGHYENGRMYLRVRSSASQGDRPDATIAASGDPTRPITIVVAGVDLLGMIDPETRESREAEADRRALRRYLNRPQGEALIELVPAIYAALEEQTPSADHRLEAVRRPLGVMRTLLDLAAKQHGGFPNRQAILGASVAARMQANCRGQCEVRGRSFLLHNNGLFDIVSNVRGEKSKAASSFDGLAGDGPAQQSPTGSRAKDFIDDYFNDLPEEEKDRLRRECWGDCGPSCSFGFTMDSCREHDYCVQLNGHWACSHDAPDGESLMTTIWDVTRYHLGIADGTCTSDCGWGGPSTGNFGDPYSDPASWYCDSCYTPTNGGFCTFDVNCIEVTTTGG